MMCGVAFWSTLREVLLTAAALAGLYVAFAGLNTWRAQLRGKTEYELARRLLRSAYAVRDAVGAVRAPFISVEEMSAATHEAKQKWANSENPAATIDELAATYSKRWEFLQGKYSDFVLEALEAEVAWAQAAIDVVNPLKDCITELRVALTMWLKQRPQDRFDNDKDLMKRLSSTVMPIPDDAGIDQFGEKVKSVIERIEAFSRPKLHP